MLNKTRNFLVGLVVMILCNCMSFGASAYNTAIWGTNVNAPTAEQISAMYYKFGLDNDFGFSYNTEASVNAPFSSGSPSNATLNRAINSVNFIRYIAGVNYDIMLASEYNKLTQDAALINAVNRKLTHGPVKPDGFPDDLYASAAKGSSESNMAMNLSSGAWFSGIERDPFYDVAHLWMADDDNYNLAKVPHRRWILNPTMQYTGYGVVERHSPVYESFRSLYTHNGALQNSNTTGVIWPAQNMPTELFESSYPWSYSVGRVVNASNLKVSLTRISDGQTWQFSAGGSNGFFSVENSYFGQAGCIIFRPDNINYNSGDVFNVAISGDVSANYFVSFFELSDYQNASMSDAQLVPQKTPMTFEETVTAPIIPEVTITEGEMPLGEMDTGIFGGASAWAIDSIEKANDLGFLDGLSNLSGNYQNDITRTEFCSIVVKYFETMGGELPKNISKMPFLDTDDENVAIAYELGIVNGISETEFSPNSKITREQMAVMMCNAHEALNMDYSGKSSLDKFTDCDQVSDWAWDSLSFMNENDIIRGYSEEIIAPVDNATREQAIVIIMRATTFFGE